MLKIFGQRLRKARLEKKLSQKGLGLALGLSDKTISSYESGRSYPNLEMLQKFVEILGKPVEYFVLNEADGLLTNYYTQQIDTNQKELNRLVGDLLEKLKQAE